MYMLAYIYMHFCTHTPTHTPFLLHKHLFNHLYIYIQIYICLRIYVYVFMYVRTHTYTLPRSQTSIRTYIYIYVPTYIYVHITHKYISLYLHSDHTHTPPLSKIPSTNFIGISIFLFDCFLHTCRWYVTHQQSSTHCPPPRIQFTNSITNSLYLCFCPFVCR